MEFEQGVDQGRFFDCQGCGARLTFAPGSEELVCEYCGHRQEIEARDEAAVAEIVEHDFREALRAVRTKPLTELMVGGREVNCKNCGATTVLDKQAGHCPYCDSPVVARTPSERDEGVIVPESVLPFKLDERRARESFRRWVGSLWFAPNDLQQRAAAEGIDGVYMPYWTYDSYTTTHYRGQRGEYYWETEYYTDAQGNQQSKQVRKTRWYPASGVVRVPFDDVLVCATRSLPHKLLNALEPWDLHELKPYDPAYLSGFIAERYAIGLEEGFKLAEERMKPHIRAACRADIGGDTQRVHSMSIRHANVTFKHTLLPLWISSFRYKGKVYRFVVNARTGEVSGERPYSWVKILLAVLAALAVVGAIIYFVSVSGAA
ncbi:MAG: hypothetical protein D6731_25790 [Planctomycetota bacterium]|nr:MAG: hypothetical protein D6731_25790 [Planctomycetota bacterium]